MADFPSITSLIPQRPPFLFVNRVINFEPESGQLSALANFPDDSLAVKEGIVNQAAIIEVLAQTSAAMVGLKNHQPGRQPAIGYLAAISNFTYLSAARSNTDLTCSVNTVRELGPFLIINGICKNGQETVAQGELTFFLEQQS